MKKVIRLHISLGIIVFAIFFVSPVFATISITTNGNSDDQNVNITNNSNQNNSGITVTANGESDSNIVNSPSQDNQNSGSVTITNEVSSNNVPESNPSVPSELPAKPSITPVINNSPVSNQSVSIYLTTEPSVSPSPFIKKPTVVVASHPDKPKKPLIFFFKIWNGIAGIVGNFFHKSHNIK